VSDEPLVLGIETSCDETGVLSLIHISEPTRPY
jgi:tRNA A37 threonylcarbamoyltransferase TsaD